MNQKSKNQKPDLSLASIINMSMGFLGIQMAFGLQNGNASRILSNFGADVHELSWFWLVAPITGLLVQPLIGHFGDQTWTFMGRRKPYFLAGSILAALGLIFLPNSSIIAGESLSSTEFIGISAILWIGVAFLALMDASINIAMEPFRALVGDMLPKRQGTLGFSVQTILIGIGAVFGSFLPYILANWFGVSNIAAVGMVPHNVVWSFYIGAAVLMTTIIYTIVTTKEYSPEAFDKYNEVPLASETGDKSIMAIFKDISNMSLRMKRLGWVQFFSWFGLFTMWVYTTSALATHHYGLPTTDTHSETYNLAGDWVGVLFAVYNFVALVYAFLIPAFAKATSRKFVHMFSLLMGGIGLLSMYFITDPDLLWISMVGIGMAWASILSMPYALLIDSIPLHKMGVYMGIFNFFIVIPQIINGIFGGIIVNQFFNDHAIYYLCFGGVLFILAALLTLRIDEPLFNEHEYLTKQENQID
ncbi:MFS transporter [Flavobacteriaceae bacterium Ap0902]|nr:MFS transporter [Flavobacteriaceae bacterium Ap0902]